MAHKNSTNTNTGNLRVPPLSAYYRPFFFGCGEAAFLRPKPIVSFISWSIPAVSTGAR